MSCQTSASVSTELASSAGQSAECRAYAKTSHVEDLEATEPPKAVLS